MSLKTFTDAYIDAALWSTNDESDESGGKPLDRSYGRGDIAPETLATMKSDCKEFYEAEEEHWSGRVFGPGIDDEQAGRLFLLSRNGHGTGFFDEDDLPEEQQKHLQKAARGFGTFNLYVGDDGEIHGSPLRTNKRGSKRRSSKRRGSKRRRSRR